MFLFMYLFIYLFVYLFRYYLFDFDFFLIVILTYSSMI